MRICDLPTDQIKLGTRVKSAVLPKFGHISSIDTSGIEPIFWISWEDGKSRSSFKNNDNKSEVVEMPIESEVSPTSIDLKSIVIEPVKTPVMVVERDQFASWVEMIMYVNARKETITSDTYNRVITDKHMYQRLVGGAWERKDIPPPPQNRFPDLPEDLPTSKKV